MNSSVRADILTDDRLRRILTVELAQGCANRAVIGGLDALLLKIGAGSSLRDAVAALRGKRYAELDPLDRRRWLDHALKQPPGKADSPPAAKLRMVPAQAVPPPKTPKPAPAQNTTAAPPRVEAKPAPRRPQAKPPAVELTAPVSALPGIGAGRAEVLARLDLRQVRDLLFHFPHRHDDFSRIAPISELQVGVEQTVVVNVWSSAATILGHSFRKSTELVVGDETGNLRVVFFNNPYPAASLRTNQRVVLSGKVSVFQGRRQLDSPEWEIIEHGSDLDQAIHTGRLVPVYPLTQGIQQRTLRGYVRTALDRCADLLRDSLPAGVRERHALPELADAVRQAHYPDSTEALELARRRLAFDELFTLQLAVLSRRSLRQRATIATPLPLPAELRAAFRSALPFPLTGAQQRSCDEIAGDLERSTPMARLLQGDVGSGKTVVAAEALLAAVANGFQGAIMAPTEILAEQHFRTLTRLFGAGDSGDDAVVRDCTPPWLGRPLRLALLRGSLKAKAKRQAQEAIAAGEVEIAVGTQALIQNSVGFARLGLSVVDEQHRFGVAQRSALSEKGPQPHLLVMTATPIPRTLQLSVYGDLDSSLIDELPPGRLPVRTRVVDASDRDYAYRFLRGQVQQGFQAFVICPLVEESEASDARAATEEYERLRQDVYPDLHVALLHGRMTPADKDAVMTAFRDGAFDILVSTSVVEVGIDIPRATVIMIEGADRFGLAQLHQFRGRVGRNGDQAYCLLLAENASPVSLERLKLLEATTNGQKVAEADLQLRGPGDYFGTRQSGLPALKQARLTDFDILRDARADALAIIERDPQLSAAEHAELRVAVAGFSERAGQAN